MDNSSFSRKLVVEFFDTTLNLFQRWSKEHFHCGFWDKDTTNLEEALVNATKFIVACLELKEDDIVLDAGCGIGGSSRYVASNFGLKIIGITTSLRHLKRAKELSQTPINGSVLDFYNQDFTQTAFPDRFFTKIFAIESMCYAPQKEDFIKEAYRLLKPGGRVAVADLFKRRLNLNTKERRIYSTFLNGWALPGFDTVQEIIQKMRHRGFRNVVYYDKHDAVRYTSKLVFQKGKKWYPVTYLFSKFKIIPKTWHNHILAAYHQKMCLDQNILRYGVLVAEKQRS